MEERSTGDSDVGWSEKVDMVFKGGKPFFRPLAPSLKMIATASMITSTIAHPKSDEEELFSDCFYRYKCSIRWEHPFDSMDVAVRQNHGEQHHGEDEALYSSTIEHILNILYTERTCSNSSPPLSFTTSRTTFLDLDLHANIQEYASHVFLYFLSHQNLENRVTKYEHWYISVSQPHP